MMAAMSETLQRLVRKAFDVDSTDKKACGEWIQRTRRMYGLSITNGLAVWDEIVQYIAGGHEENG